MSHGAFGRHSVGVKPSKKWNVDQNDVEIAVFRLLYLGPDSGGDTDPAKPDNAESAPPDLKTQIGHNIGLQAPIKIRKAWVISRACRTASAGWCSAWEMGEKWVRNG